MAPPRVSVAGFLLALTIVTSDLLALAAVLGIDFGTGYIKASLVKSGRPLEIVLTKDTRRKEQSSVAFKSLNPPQADGFPERLYGADALALAPRFPSDFFPNLKPLLGAQAQSPRVVDYVTRHPSLQVEPDSARGTATFRSKLFSNSQGPWTVEELIAMQLESVRKNAESMMEPDTRIRSAVLTVPPYYTDDERHAILAAAELAGLHVLSLMTDGLAVGLNYATGRALPEPSSKPEIHMIFDVGAGSTKASVLRFHNIPIKIKGSSTKTRNVPKVQVLGSGWERDLGGDSFNNLIVDDIIAEFCETPSAKKARVDGASLRRNGRAMAKLSKEAERIRHVLSANQKTSASIEALHDDVNFSYSISRDKFVEMASGLADRMLSVARRALTTSGIGMSEVDSIILHGGVSRTPFVQKRLEELAGEAEKVRSNVNADEAAVFGAGFRAAELAPTFRVKEILVSEAASYEVGVQWVDRGGSRKQHYMWQADSPVGQAGKEVLFDNVDDFSVMLVQKTETGIVGTSEVSTKNLTASVAELKEKHGCLESDIQLKAVMRINVNTGIAELDSMAAECDASGSGKDTLVDGVKNLFGLGKGNKDAAEGETQKVLKDTEAPADGSKSSDDNATQKGSSPGEKSSGTASGSASAAASDQDSKPSSAAKEKTKKMVRIKIGTTWAKAGVPRVEKGEMTRLKGRLKEFSDSDRNRKLREEALNELEGFTYKVKDFLEDGKFLEASTPEERQKIEAMASETGDWIYGDGADAPRAELQGKLGEIRGLTDVVHGRIRDREALPGKIQELQLKIASFRRRARSIRKDIRQRLEKEAQESSSESRDSSAAPPPEAKADGQDEEMPDPLEVKLDEDENDMYDKMFRSYPLQAEDIAPYEKATDLAAQWLDEMKEKQSKVGPLDVQVLTSKMLDERSEKLEVAGGDLIRAALSRSEEQNKKMQDAEAKKPAETKAAENAGNDAPGKAKADKEPPREDTKGDTSNDVPPEGQTGGEDAADQRVERDEL